MAKKTPFNFSKAMESIEEILSHLEEQKDLDLEKSVEHVEKGLELVEKCKDHLKKVENKVEKLKVKFDKDEDNPTDKDVLF